MIDAKASFQLMAAAICFQLRAEEHWDHSFGWGPSWDQNPPIFVAVFQLVVSGRKDNRIIVELWSGRMGIETHVRSLGSLL